MLPDLQERMDDLRKGKSAVKEWNHTLLVGWTDRRCSTSAFVWLGVRVFDILKICVTARVYGRQCYWDQRGDLSVPYSTL